MATAQVLNVHQIVFALEQHGRDMEQAVQDELHTLAGMAASRMKILAPKFQSFMTNSINVKKTGDMEYEVRPAVGYAPFVEYGIKPGGKGLPRFFDPASAQIVEWLKRTPNKKTGATFNRRAVKGSKVFQASMLSLRDRYEGLAWHIRKEGVKPHPFVEPVHDEMKPIVLKNLSEAVRRVLAARPDAGGATA